MSKKHNQIIRIIKSLSSQEARAYKRWVYQKYKTESSFMKIFDMIRSTELTNETELLHHLKIKNFNRISNYLYHSVTKFLIEQETDHPKIQIQKQLILVLKLMDRNLLEEALSILQQLLILAKKYEYINSIHEILALSYTCSLFLLHNQLNSSFKELEVLLNESVINFNFILDEFTIKKDALNLSKESELAPKKTSIINWGELLNRSIYYVKNHPLNNIKYFASQNIVLLTLINQSESKKIEPLLLEIYNYEASKNGLSKMYQLKNLITFYDLQHQFEYSNNYLDEMAELTNSNINFKPIYNDVKELSLLRQKKYEELIHLKASSYNTILAYFYLGNFEVAKSKIIKEMHMLKPNNTQNILYSIILLIIDIKENGTIKKDYLVSNLKKLLKKDQKEFWLFLEELLASIQEPINTLNINDYIEKLNTLQQKIPLAIKLIINGIDSSSILFFFCK